MAVKRSEPVEKPPTLAHHSAQNNHKQSTLSRFGLYLLRRLVITAITVVAGVYIAIFVINFGGFVDDIFRDRITGTLMGMGMSMTDVSAEEKARILAETEAAMTESFGLNDPFPLRTLRFLTDGLTLNWGESERFTTADRQRSVRAVILERLPNTLLLAGLSNLILFLLSVFIALYLSRRYGSFLDSLLILLAPLSSIPSWIYGAILITLFAVELNWLPMNGMRGVYPPETRLDEVGMVARHMLLPVLGIVLSTLFQGIYAWRTFFLIQSEEDYVEMGKAKGLPSAMLERRYILRPALPVVLTSFSLMLISFWQNAIALEVLFRWPGIGTLFLQALNQVDRGVTIGLVVTFAYLLGLSLLILDLVYALVDPRIQVSEPSRTGITRVNDGLWAAIRRRVANRGTSSGVGEDTGVFAKGGQLPGAAICWQACRAGVWPSPDWISSSAQPR